MRSVFMCLFADPITTFQEVFFPEKKKQKTKNKGVCILLLENNI